MLKSTRNLVLMLCICLSIPICSLAQVEKFGKFDNVDLLKMTVYPKDSSAEAVVLFDVGQLYYKFNSSAKEFEWVVERHVRIKILNKTAYSLADIEIPFYEGNGGAKELISNLKGFTYNLVNDKIEKTKLENDGIFTEKVSQKRRKKKFTLPNIKEGSVIEYTYTQTSPFIYYLPTWVFQREVPVIWSEYTTSIPEYFVFRKNMSGYEAAHISKEDSKTETAFINGDNFNYNTYSHRIVLKDIPAFKNEKFITTPLDYLSKIEYYLSSIVMPRQPVYNHQPNWDVINKELLDDSDFGGKLKARGELKEIAQLISALAKNPEEKMTAIYNEVRKRIKWDETHSIGATQPLRKVYESKLGSVGDINLLLIALLREADIQAEPVILSTRSHGRVNTFVPTLNDFNYVVALAKIGGKEIFLDATQSAFQPNILPFKCLNGEGRIISENNPGWVDLLKGAGKQSKNFSINVKANAEGKLIGDLNLIYNDYPASYIRGQIFKENEEKFIEKEWKSDKANFKVNNHKIENLQDISQPLRLVLNIDLENEVGADIIYLNPLLVKHFDENPLKAEDRKFPVDFGSPLVESYMFSLDIPQGYQIDDMPKNLSLSTPDKSATFSYAIGQVGEKIQLRTRLVINRPIYGVDEYQTIRTFFTQLVAKQDEQIVLKKKSN